MKAIYVVKSTPEKIRESILKDVKFQIDQLRSELQSQKPTQYITRQELSFLCKIDIRTVSNWCRSGKIKPCHFGRRVFFQRNGLTSLLTNL